MSETDQDIKIAVLQSEVHQIKELCGKVEETIQSIHRLQTDISVILKLQEEKIKYLTDTCIKVKEDVSEVSDILHKRIDEHVEIDLNFHNEIKEFVDNSVNKKLKIIQKSSEETEKRLQNLERYFWMGAGGIAIIGLFFTNYKWIMEIFQN